MKFTILGYIPSKKNETRKGKYGNWYNAKQKEISDIILRIRKQRREPMITGNVRAEYYIQCHYRRQDRSNIIATCDDALEKAGVIKNDRQIVQECSFILYGIKNPETTIRIEKL